MFITHFHRYDTLLDRSFIIYRSSVVHQLFISRSSVVHQSFISRSSVVHQSFIINLPTKCYILSSIPYRYLTACYIPLFQYHPLSAPHPNARFQLHLPPHRSRRIFARRFTRSSTRTRTIVSAESPIEVLASCLLTNGLFSQSVDVD